jgi:hypothetical protein
MTDMLRRALKYAAADWPVFPCKPGDKVPLGALVPNGVKNATVDPAVITSWWERCPTANVAIATGGNAPDVLDFDVKNGAAGRKTYALLRDAGLLRGTHAVVGTPSGGWHMYYLGSDQGNAAMHRHGVDLRSRGGYVLAPPSLVDGKPYTLSEWRTRFDDKVRHVDLVAIRKLLDPPIERRTVVTTGIGRTDALIRHVAGQSNGNRNNALHWAACRAAESGAGDDVFDQLLEAATSIGLSSIAAANTIRSARSRTGAAA